MLSRNQKKENLVDRLIVIIIQELAREEKTCLENNKVAIENRLRFQSKYRDAFMAGQSEFNAATPLFLDRKPFFDEVVDKLRNIRDAGVSSEQMAPLRSPFRREPYTAGTAANEDVNNMEYINEILDQDPKSEMVQRITSQCIPNGFLFNPTFQSDYLKTPCFKGLHPSNPLRSQMEMLEQEQGGKAAYFDGGRTKRSKRSKRSKRTNK